MNTRGTALAGAVVAVLVFVVAACGSATSATTSTTGGGLAVSLRGRLAAVRGFHEFPIYWLGSRYGNLPLTAITIDRVDVVSRDRTRIIRTHSHRVTFIYGSCTTPSDADEQSCAPPLDVQNWPACGRNAALYHLRLPLTDQIRSAPAKRFGDRVEIWTGPSDVVIFYSPHAPQVASALRSANRLTDIKPGQPLPTPSQARSRETWKCTA